jgi:hypothetical protein
MCSLVRCQADRGAQLEFPRYAGIRCLLGRKSARGPGDTVKAEDSKGATCSPIVQRCSPGIDPSTRSTTTSNLAGLEGSVGKIVVTI